MTEPEPVPQRFGTLRFLAGLFSLLGIILIILGGVCLIGFIGTLTGNRPQGAYDLATLIGLPAGAAFALVVGLVMVAYSEHVQVELANADNLAALRQALDQLVKAPAPTGQLELHLRAIAGTSTRTAVAVETLAATVKPK